MSAARLMVCRSCRAQDLVETRAEKLVEVGADTAPLAICRAALAATAA